MEDIQHTSDPIKAALFVDFDNIYIGLRKVHPKAAEEFATNPAGWLAWFERGMPSRDHDDSNVYRRRPLIVSDTDNYRAFRRGLHVGAGIRSWLGVPLIEDGELLGMIALDKAEPNFYSDEHQRLALPYASVVARAVKYHAG